MTTRTSTPKRLFILGATGGIGGALIDQALERGHRVTAFVRDSCITLCITSTETATLHRDQTGAPRAAPSRRRWGQLARPP